MRTQLFNLKFEQKQQNDNPLLIPTSLGKVNVRIQLNDKLLSVPNLIGKISKNANIYIWNTTDIHFELLKIHFQPSLPIDMKVDNCIGFLCRFKCLSKNIQVDFSYCLESLDFLIRPTLETGEGIVAQTWQDPKSVLTIGTEDEEALLNRAVYKKYLPYRFSTENLLSYEIFHYLKNGLTISLPSFYSGEVGQMQMIISHAKSNTGDPLSTWFAIDMPYRKLLEKIGL